MKFKNISILSIFAFILMNTSSVFAQQDEKAQKILDQMSDFYINLSAFSADIHQEAISTNEGLIGDMNIKALISGNKYRMELEGQVIYSDTKTVYRFDQEMEEVTIEEADTEGDLASSPAEIYQLYKKNFKYLYTGNEGGLDIIDLSPEKDSDINFFRIRMFIKPSTHELVKWEMYEKGNLMKYVYTVSNFKKNISVTEKDFMFDTASHPDVEVVDLR
ncbi:MULTISPECIES: LolA family protein [Flammeovirga]|uniref:Outer membrane lipoprotein carrier protein LolA n=1 Tax=Flammeovirga agarivorans TaxID=2726742 RepID=A0A7X8XV20_9BACT|nr:MULTISPECIES: outer membrane lipoprotein carrier protein LolA [Flammeovirga]NLR90886.1 outer membrane lipoprotein carrier protein LolA [Flammeovirga agarivorans]